MSKRRLGLRIIRRENVYFGNCWDLRLPPLILADVLVEGITSVVGG